MDSALRYINNTLLRGDLTAITLDNILELHRRLLSFVDLREAGRLRRSQVVHRQFCDIFLGCHVFGRKSLCNPNLRQLQFCHSTA